ncbi:MAG: CRP/FNR family transcriptional regulator [Paracoccaceae bacterium]|jgi:CRP/FNR family transcriptional regulator
MDWISRFNGLASLKAPIRNILTARSVIVSVPKDTLIFGPGKAPENLLLLLEGTVRVQQTSDQGREIVLYRVHAGESCVLTTACLLAYEDYSAEGIAETDVQAVAIPRAVFDDLISQSQTFRQFVFSAYSRRITDLFVVIEEIAFRRVDIRLAQRLLELAGQDQVIHATHQQMAAELGTAREVISRQLQEFHRRGWVSQTRGTITINNISGLKSLVTSAA